MVLIPSTQRFSSRVDQYLRYRPGYPGELLPTMQKECGLTGSMIVADIGSGTGLLTRIFLENGNQVFAVEPNAEMRAAGERLLAGFLNFHSIAATAESTTLDDHSIDLVAAAQAAHWFEAAKAQREFLRILKPGGWVVFVWNQRSIDGAPLLRDYEQLLLRFGTDYQEVRHERTTAALNSFFTGARFQVRVFKNEQEFDYQGLEGRLLSSSYTPEPGHPGYGPMLQELRRIFDLHQQGGRVRFEYDTHLYFGQLA